ncbi:hypothetical protein D3C86_1876360 [compost metagenome]
MDQHQLGLEVLEDRGELGEHPAREVRQGLARLHEIQVGVRDDAEEVQDLVEHLAVLGGDADLEVQVVGLGDRKNHRRHLDGLGAGAEDAENSGFTHLWFPWRP